jgi:branched-chain amino acid transport system ATP-binding protein
MALLEIRNLSKNFGGLAALNKLDLDVCDAEILGLIGPNGAGKTTLFNVISGFIQPTHGKIMFRDQDIIGLKAHKIAQMGIGRTFQASTLFMEQSLLENIYAGFHMSYKVGAWKAFLHTGSATDEEKIIRQKAAEITEFIGLYHSKDELAKNLPHGYQRLLQLGIALATYPKLLLLDEPVTGMNPEETSRVVSLIRKIRDDGVTIMVVEHDMHAVMNLCDRIVALGHGRKLAEGLPEEIRRNEEVIDAYLGTA